MEAIKVLEERINTLISKRDRIINLVSQLKANDESRSLTFDNLNREADSIVFAISELKSCIVDLRRLKNGK